MAKSSKATDISLGGWPRLAFAFHWIGATWTAGDHSLGLEERSARAAKLGCAALALTAVSLFGIAEVPAPLRLAAPVIGISMALPLVVALWLPAISPRRARLLAQLAALALVAVGSASFERATATVVILANFVPAILLLRAGDEVSG